MKYKTKKINYTSRKFKKSLEKVKQEGELIQKLSKIDTSKLNITFDI